MTELSPWSLASLLLDKNFGLIKFLQLVCPNKYFEGCRADVLKILLEYYSGKRYERCVGVKEVWGACVASYTTDLSVDIKTLSLDVLCQLIAVSGSGELPDVVG